MKCLSGKMWPLSWLITCLSEGPQESMWLRERDENGIVFT